MSDADLEYAGRERKRPPGASDLVQRIYTLLDEDTKGMTRDELWAILREGWLETDAYRAYDHYLAGRRTYEAKRRAEGRAFYQHRPPAAKTEYGSDLFKERAQKWWISQALQHMRANETATREGDRWFVGMRAPRVIREGKTRYYAPLDPVAQRAASRADTQAHIRREQIKARFLADLNDPKLRTGTRKNIEHLRETIRLGYEYLSGR